MLKATILPETMPVIKVLRSNKIMESHCQQADYKHSKRCKNRKSQLNQIYKHEFNIDCFMISYFRGVFIWLRNHHVLNMFFVKDYFHGYAHLVKLSIVVNETSAGGHQGRDSKLPGSSGRSLRSSVFLEPLCSLVHGCLVCSKSSWFHRVVLYCYTPRA